MEFQFLGTSSGFPTKQRNVSALALRMSNAKNWHLVDCGEGTQHQLLHTPYSLVALRAIFITHIHGDHCYGLPGLLASAGLAGRTAPLQIIAPKAIEEYIHAVRTITGLRLPYELEFIAVEEFDTVREFEDITVTAVELSHRVPSFGYAFFEKNVERQLDTDKLRRDGIAPSPLWGELQRGRNVKLEDGKVLKSENYVLKKRSPRGIVVGGDNDTPGLLNSVCEKADVLIHEATYTEKVAERVGPSPQHCTAAKIAQFAENAAVKNLVLTHFSARYQSGGLGESAIKYEDIESNSIDSLAAEARAFYTGHLYLARDFDSYVLDKTKVLSNKKF